MCLLKRFMEKGTYNKTVEPIGVSRSALFRIQHLDRLTPMAHLFRLPANDAGKRADKPPACSHVTGRCTVARRARDAGQPLIALNVRSTVDVFPSARSLGRRLIRTLALHARA